MPSDSPRLRYGSQPWERQAGERKKPWEAFRIYRDMGPSRTIARAAASQGKAAVTWEAWSREFSWVARASAWDEEVDRKEREEHLQTVRDMTKRHVQEARALQAKAIARLQSLDPGELSPREVLRYFVEAVRLERTAVGEPEQIIETRQSGQVGLDLSSLSDDELETLDRVLTRAQGSAPDDSDGEAD